MTTEQILKKFNETINELGPIYDKLNVNGRIDLREDNIYLGMTFVSKVYGINSLFNDEFIKENNLSQLVKMIDTEMVKMQASHYSDKNLFYEFINVIYPQLKYRLSQINYRYSLSEDERKKLLITAEYQVYLTKLLKYYLEQQTTEENQKAMKEILAVLNLYKVVNDKNIVALGSEITYLDTVNNEVIKGKIVINSHANPNFKKYALSNMKPLFGSRINDIVCVDFSTSYFVRILDIKNIEEKPGLDKLKN